MRDGISDDHHQQGSSAWGKPSAHPGFMNWHKSHGEVINSNPQIQMQIQISTNHPVNIVAKSVFDSGNLFFEAEFS